jgi:hypothetical protein
VAASLVMSGTRSAVSSLETSLSSLLILVVIAW